MHVVEDGTPWEPVEPKINLYIKTTNACNARCKFCEYHTEASKETFDLYKLLYVIDEIQKYAPIHRVNFTGGEPTVILPFDVFIKAVNLVREKLPKAYIIINTNGVRLKELGIGFAENIVDSYALSRHHYLDDRNARIFGVEDFPTYISTNFDIRNFPYPDRLHLRCNLIKGEIDSVESIREYVNYYTDRYGITAFGFVSLWPLNQFCIDNKTENDTILIKTLPNILRTRTKTKVNRKCSCYNYLYSTPSGNIASIYTRIDTAPTECASQIIYDVNCVRSSFSGEVIFE